MVTLVTGGAGFIGRWVVKRLLDLNHHVVVMDDLSSGRRENLAEFEGVPGFVSFERVDVTDQRDLQRVFSLRAWDNVFHLAASINVQQSIDDPTVTFRNDVDGTFTLLEACRGQYFRLNGLDVNDRRFHIDEVRGQLTDRRPRVLVMSTCMVYSRAESESGIAEDHPTLPASPYAASKIAADNLALAYYFAYGMPVTVARPFNTYGPFQKSNLEGGVVSIFLKRDIERQPLLIKGDGTQTRDLLYVEDCADFVVRAALSPAAEGEVINAGTGRDIAIRDLASMVATAGNSTEFVRHDHPQAEIPRLLCNPTKARSRLDWQPATPLDEGLAKTRAWLNEKRWAW